MVRNRALCLIVLADVLAGLAGPAMAADIEAGRQTYWRYCSSCHGEAADGMGPMRPVLTIKPADLTGLAARNDGRFPLERVIARIDGRDPLVSHGSEMPVYGDFFLEGGRVTIAGEDGARVSTSGAVADLVAWLRTIQAN